MILAKNGSSSGSSFVSSSSVLTDIQTTLSDLQESLSESRKLERRLKLALGEQTVRSSQLEDTLKRERTRNEKLLEVMRGVDSSSSTTTPRGSDSPLSTLHDNKNILDTVSPILMQYRYDELSLSHKRCLKILSRKESLLKTALSEKESIQAKYDDLLVQFQKLQKKTEVLCCKYFTLRAKKTEEARRGRRCSS
ncbi:unnamed protein product [Hermetia illucens]|uniref:Uncharacterized protein n=1 Tax=Hermetia illucens TaxID=343691 RepID=A0A7R8UIV7_HERIL|nr:unnamed protein product [Hermetia illucens]